MAGRDGGRAGKQGRGRNYNHHARRIDQDSGSVNDFNDSKEMNTHISERFKGRSQKHASSASATIDSFDLELNNEIRQYVHSHENNVKSAEAGDWRGRPEIPTNNEISLGIDETVTLIANKQKGKWKSKERYLKAQYELHREDAVSPLRDAVDKFRKNPNMADDETLSIYEKVHVCGFTFSQLGIAARIQFSTARAGRHILWQSSKRLVSGTLVALTPADNNFESKCIVALVGARALAGLELTPLEIDLFFCRPEDIHIDPQQEWIMVEAKTGYYEAYRHTLKALQKLSHEPFSFSSQLCSLDPEIEPPAYLKENPIMNLSPATAEDKDRSYGDVNVLTAWPSHSLSTLDESQWSALHQTLCKSLAVIQGPPGTGKTYCSKVALEILHGYLKDDDAPIIIAAQTNHALDQLLGHVSKFEPNFVRLGGRSTNIEVKKRALYEIRSKERIPLIPGGLLGKATSNWSLQSKQMVELLKPLHQGTNEPLSLTTLAEYGIITQKQSESLGAGASRWVTSDGQQADPLGLWLDRNLIPFKVDWEINNFGLNEEDEDLEIEQLREHEAEHGVNDEEDAELLKGSWCFVQDNFTVPDAPETDLERAAEMIRTHQDLWKVPEHLRGPMYKIMQQRFKAVLQQKFRQVAAVYEKNLKDLKIGKWERDSVFLKRVKIIGLTTTGLSKYRPLIASLKPKIILIEEAAEVLEAPVTVACMESVEHLILVGDHQQLQGQCSARELENHPFYLNVSLFERLVKNNIPYKTLLQQRRMEPAFRQLIHPLYPGLEDHSSVVHREPFTWGMGKVKSFFFSHDWSEYKDTQMSTYNQEEAKFVAGFYRYLIQNGVPSSAVTILTFYNGQRKRLLKEIRAVRELRDFYSIVKTVDSYQGEENEIVILSLTRSNTNGQIGFLDISNRVCVALSRAKLGFYIFGNANLLASRSPLWDNVINTMLAERRLAAQQFPIYCDIHDATSIVEYPDDWSKYDGGCAEPCRTRLPCGHRCLLKCHPFPHDRVFCAQKCQMKLACGHDCQGRCSEICSCTCPEFAEGQGHSSGQSINVNGQVDGARQSYHDVRLGQPLESTPNHGVGGTYISGQQTSHVRSAPYLQIKQDPILIDLSEPGTEEQSKHGMLAVNLKNIPAGSGQASFPIPKKSTSEPYPDGFPSRLRLSPEEQAKRRNDWKSFAAGGFKEDDETRQWSVVIKGPSMKNKDWPTLQKANETEKALGRGRKKFTQEYRAV